MCNMLFWHSKDTEPHKTQGSDTLVRTYPGTILDEFVCMGRETRKQDWSSERRCSGKKVKKRWVKESSQDHTAVQWIIWLYTPFQFCGTASGGEYTSLFVKGTFILLHFQSSSHLVGLSHLSLKGSNFTCHFTAQGTSWHPYFTQLFIGGRYPLGTKKGPGCSGSWSKAPTCSHSLPSKEHSRTAVRSLTFNIFWIHQY